MDVEYTTRVHKEGRLYVAHAQEHDVSSAGASIEDACSHLREAVELFLEEAERMGTLTAILEEGGYVRVGDEWRPPQVLATERTRVPVGSR